MTAVPEQRSEAEASELETAADEAISACGGDLRNAIEALIVANQYLEEQVGVLGAFSRTGDPMAGEFSDAVVLRSFGEVPVDFNARR